LDKYDVTVGRFRQFVNAWREGWLPAPGSGKHAYLNGGNGLVDIGTATDGSVTYELGWVAFDDTEVTPTDANLGCAPETDTACGLSGDAGLIPCNHAYASWGSFAADADNLPINLVNWYEAYAFCIWDGGFLPSEAEWEYAAAAGSEQREYPWGSATPKTEYAIFGCEYPDPASFGSTAKIAPVGAAGAGAGLWGQLDLAGEVSQWTLDWYGVYVNPCADCTRQTNIGTTTRVHRGGSFDVAPPYPTERTTNIPTTRYTDLGFRCARPP